MDQEVKELWDIYRSGKIWANSTEHIEGILLLERDRKAVDSLPEMNQETSYPMPRAGSIFYVEQIDPPWRFVKEVMADNIVIAEWLRCSAALGKRGITKSRRVRCRPIIYRRRST